jgi:hypothetical protein
MTASQPQASKRARSFSAAFAPITITNTLPASNLEKRKAVTRYSNATVFATTGIRLDYSNLQTFDSQPGRGADAYLFATQRRPRICIALVNSVRFSVHPPNLQRCCAGGRKRSAK